ncbi:MAG: hypothetical protein ACE37F_32710 [Nannocystaceae bacterium]|nr:hypothetical protein [bacterium]
MSENLGQDLEELLAREGTDDVDTLMAWARERASALASSAGEDPELGPLLSAGGQAGDAPPPPEPSSAQAGPSVEQPPLAARREPSNAAPLPPIPVTTPATPTDELEIDEIEELDVEELELLDDVDDDDDDGVDEGQGARGETDEEDADTNVGPPPNPPGEAEPADEDAPSYGPPDGNDVVPEWKAALMSTQTDSDEEAAARVKEASSAEPLPTAPEPDPSAMPLSGRLEAEEDEISRHSIDLSDLDTDDE